MAVIPPSVRTFVTVKTPIDGPGETVALAPTTRLPFIVPLPESVCPAKSVSAPSAPPLTSNAAPDAIEILGLLPMDVVLLSDSVPPLITVLPV